MTAKAKVQPSPVGRPATTAARGRAQRSEDYREARDEYAAIRALRQRNWIAAHIRERRYELDLTQHEVAERAGTSHSFISKLEPASTSRQSPCSSASSRFSTRSS